MRRLIHRAVALVLSIALSASGAAPGAASHAAPKTAAAHRDHVSMAHHDASDHAEHKAAHHHGGHAVDPGIQDDTDQPGSGGSGSVGHASLTCCSMCIAAGPLPFAVDSIVAFTITEVLFALRYSTRTGTLVPIDPGIPKPA